KWSGGDLSLVRAWGVAAIAGTVMVTYATVLSPAVPDAMGHILSASIISIPAAIVLAAVMVPPRGDPTSGKLALPQQSSSAMDAITQGTLDGLSLLLSVVAMLVVLIALVSLVNLALGLVPQWGGAPG